MSTSMLDALIAEQNEVMDLAISASRSAIEAVRRCNLLRKQMEALAAEERAAPPALTADASEEEFRQFQAEHFPDVMLGEIENSNSPETYPAAQDSGQGKEGSGALASGDVATRERAKPEQAVAVAASEERVADARNDPEAAPDKHRTRKDVALDFYAESAFTADEIGRRIGVSAAAVEAFLRKARADADSRVAQGDLLRAGEDAKLQLAESTAGDQPNDLLLLDLHDCKATYEEQTLQLVRWEFRLIHLLNSQLPMPAAQILNHCSMLSTKTLRRDIGKVNPKLAKIGVEIAEISGNRFRLRPLQPVL